MHHGVRTVTVANRTADRARALAERVGGRGVGFERLAGELAGADIVISSTDAPTVILRPAQVASAMADRADRPMLIVDISVPRDVHAAAAGVAGVALFDIDDLARVAEANLNGRRVEAQRGEGYVRDAARAFAAWRPAVGRSPPSPPCERGRRRSADRSSIGSRIAGRAFGRGPAAARRAHGRASSTSSCMSRRWPCGRPPRPARAR